MSKKLAEGAQGIVMDIKVGSGAFMKNKTQARKLAKSIRETGKRFGKNMLTTLTDMNQPLGNAVGNSLEIIESIETLKGTGPKDLTELSLHLAGAMVYLAGLSKTHAAGVKKAKAALKSGAALESFRELIKNQGGDPAVVDDYSLLPSAQKITVVSAPKSGYMKKMNNTSIGLHCVSLGGGRAKAEDEVDFGVGFVFHKKLGQKIKEGEALVSIHHNADQTDIVQKIEDALINEDITFTQKKPENLPPLIIETESAWAQ
jgi:thymidine phosphorylase